MPDLIVSSSAVRAVLTARAVSEAIDGFAPLVEEDDLYLASPRTYIDTARYLEESFQRILFVGHNPGISELLNTLTGCDTVMPTAALAQIELPINQWKRLSPQTEGQLVALWRPKEIDIP